MTDTAARIRVGDIDQLLDRVRAVADDMRRNALGDRHDLPVDDQNPVVPAGDVALDHDRCPSRLSPLATWKELAHLAHRLQIDADAAAMVAVQRLDHDRIADPVRRADGVIHIADDLAARNGDSDLVEELVGQLLVRGDVDRDVRRSRGDGRPDALLMDAMSELNQRSAGIEPDHRNVAPLGLGDDRAGRGSVGQPLGDSDDVLFEFGLIIEIRLGCRRSGG